MTFYRNAMCIAGGLGAMLAISDIQVGIRGAEVVQKTQASANSDPGDILESLKAATVFIKVVTSDGQQSGSGFLAIKDGNKGTILTNAHVLEPPRGALQSVTCVFHGGTRKEFTVNATVLGQDDTNDLAVLSVQHDSLPDPLAPPDNPRLRETLPVLILGFPFGEILTTSGRNPAITVTKGTISSIRRDDNDNVVLVQVDGGVNPGNSGGPVLTEEGKLVGTAVAKLRGAEIGFAIPERISTELLRGKVTGGELRHLRTESGKQTFELKMQVIDPQRNVKRISLLTCPAGKKIGKKAEANGSWKKLSDEMTEKEASLKGHEATAVFEIPETSEAWVCQITWSRADGTQLFTQPFDIPDPKKSAPRVASRENPVASPRIAKRNPRSETKPRPAVPKSEPNSEGSVKFSPLPADAPDLISHMVWSKDGTSVFVLSKSGILQKISILEFNEVERLDLNGSCSFLGRSKEGLVVVLDSLQQVCSVDEKSLEVKKQFRVPGVSRIACAPPSSTVYVPDKQTLLAVDLRTGRIKPLQLNMKLAGGNKAMAPREFDFLTMTPDAKYLFAESGIEMLMRMQVKGDSLFIEEYSPRIGQNSQEIIVSDDSKFVAMPSGGGNYQAEGHPEVNYGTYIYDVTNLRSPHLGVSTGAYPRMLGFDPIGKKIYAQNHDHQLIVLNWGGNKEDEYTWGNDNVRRFLVHPKGHRVCVLTESRLLLAELAQGLPVLAANEEPTEPMPKETSTEAASTYRTWTDSTGKFKTTAKLIEFKDDQVTLEKEDGKQIQMPASRLSDADRALLRDEAAKGSRDQ